jgi:signal transduction histidine kinase
MEKRRLGVRLDAIHDLSREMTLSLNVEQVAEAVLDIVERVLEFETCSLELVDEERGELYSLAMRGMEWKVAPRLPLSSAKGIVIAVARDGEPLYVPDVREDPRYVEASATTRSELAVPLKVKRGVVGVLNVESAQVDAFSPGDVVLLSTLAAQAAVAIENARLYEETQRRARELAALNKAGQVATSTLDLDEVLALAMAQARAMLDAEAASVLLYDATGDELVFAAAVGLASEGLVGTRMPATAGVAGWVMREEQPVLVRDVQSDPRFYDHIDTLTGLTTCSLLAVPLKHKERVIGVIEAINRTGRAFDEHDRDLLSTLAGSVAIAIENAQLYEAEREQHRLVEQSRVQLAQSEKLAATGRLAASMAHEINNPLQAIHNSLQLVLGFALEPGEQQEYLQMADEEVQRLMRLVKRILDFARRPQRETKPTDLNGVVEKVLALATKYLQHRHIALRRDLSPDLPAVMATADELGQVFLNLVLNAVDAMPEGGTLRVSSRLAQDGHLTMAFSDTGTGISPEHLDRIFEPFFSTMEEGTGLGLTISHNIIERHGGEITVQSVMGEGTTFTVHLPAM